MGDAVGAFQFSMIEFEAAIDKGCCAFFPRWIIGIDGPIAVSVLRALLGVFGDRVSSPFLSDGVL